MTSYTSALSGVYDKLKARERYDIWADLVLRAVYGESAPAASGVRVLDVGCGTGMTTVELRRRGFDVVGCDISAEMLRQAIGREDSAGIRWLVADMRDLPPTIGPFDLIVWMGDVINHLLQPSDVEAALESSFRRLAPGGLLSFDANTLQGMRELCGENSTLDLDGVFFAWNGQTVDPQEGELARASIDCFERVPSGSWRRSRASVVQRHYAYDAILSLLRAAGFETEPAFAFDVTGLTGPVHGEMGSKLIYVARKPR